MANFQRVMDKIITNKRLKSTYAYIDNVTVCGHDRTDHDCNLKWFRAAVEKYNLTFNIEKSLYGLNTTYKDTLKVKERWHWTLNG